MLHIIIIVPVLWNRTLRFKEFKPFSKYDDSFKSIFKLTSRVDEDYHSPSHRQELFYHIKTQTSLVI